MIPCEDLEAQGLVPAAPRLVSAAFDSTVSSVIVTFDKGTDQAGIPSGDIFACGDVIQFEDADLSDCFWSQPDRLSVAANKAPGLVPGSNITLLGGVLGQQCVDEVVERCDCFEPAAEETVSVSGPEVQIVPAASLSGVETVGACEGVTISSGTPTGGGGRPMRKRWNLVFKDEAAGQRVNRTRLDRALRRQNTGTGTDSLRLSSAELVDLVDGAGAAAQDVQVQLVLTNFLGQSTTETWDLGVRSDEPPLVRLVGGQRQKVTRSDPLSIRSAAVSSGCDGRRDADRAVSYEWTLYDETGADTGLGSTSSDPRFFKLEPFTLDVGTYILQLTSRDLVTGLESTATTKLLVKKAEVVASIGGGNRVVPVASGAIVSAAASCDEDTEGGVKGAAAGLEFAWRCDSGCAWPTDLVFSTDEDISLTDYDLTPGVYVFTVTVISADGRISSDTVTYELLEDDVPSVFIEPRHRASASLRFVLKATVAPSSVRLSSSSSTTKKTTLNGAAADHIILEGNITSWWSLSRTGGDSLAASRPLRAWALTPVRLNTVAHERPHNFVLPARALVAGSSYTFELRAQHTGNANVGISTVSFVAAAPPTLGELATTPASGVEGKTLFTLVTSLWVTEDGPLTYAFFATPLSSKKRPDTTMLRVASEDETLEAVLLPAGDVVTTSVEARDKLGGTSWATSDVSVEARPRTPGSANQRRQETRDQIEAANALGDTDAAARAVVASAADAAEDAALLADLTSYLREMSTKARNRQGRDADREGIRQLASALKSVVGASPRRKRPLRRASRVVAEDAMDSTLDIAALLDETGVDEETATSLTETLSAVLDSPLFYTNSTEVVVEEEEEDDTTGGSQQQGRRGRRRLEEAVDDVTTVIDEVNEAMLKESVLGEFAKTTTSDNLGTATQLMDSGGGNRRMQFEASPTFVDVPDLPVGGGVSLAEFGRGLTHTNPFGEEEHPVSTTIVRFALTPETQEAAVAACARRLEETGDAALTIVVEVNFDASTFLEYDNLTLAYPNFDRSQDLSSEAVGSTNSSTNVTCACGDRGNRTFWCPNGDVMQTECDGGPARVVRLTCPTVERECAEWDIGWNQGLCRKVRVLDGVTTCACDVEVDEPATFTMEAEMKQPRETVFSPSNLIGQPVDDDSGRGILLFVALLCLFVTTSVFAVWGTFLDRRDRHKDERRDERREEKRRREEEEKRRHRALDLEAEALAEEADAEAARELELALARQGGAPPTAEEATGEVTISFADDNDDDDHHHHQHHLGEKKHHDDDDNNNNDDRSVSTDAPASMAGSAAASSSSSASGQSAKQRAARKKLLEQRRLDALRALDDERAREQQQQQRKKQRARGSHHHHHHHSSRSERALSYGSYKRGLWNLALVAMRWDHPLVSWYAQWSPSASRFARAFKLSVEVLVFFFAMAVETNIVYADPGCADEYTRRGCARHQWSKWVGGGDMCDWDSCALECHPTHPEHTRWDVLLVCAVLACCLPVCKVLDWLYRSYLLAPPPRRLRWLFCLTSTKRKARDYETVGREDRAPSSKAKDPRGHASVDGRPSEGSSSSSLPPDTGAPPAAEFAAGGIDFDYFNEVADEAGDDDASDDDDADSSVFDNGSVGASSLLTASVTSAYLPEDDDDDGAKIILPADDEEATFAYDPDEPLPEEAFDALDEALERIPAKAMPTRGSTPQQGNNRLPGGGGGGGDGVGGFNARANRGVMVGGAARPSPLMSRGSPPKLPPSLMRAARRSRASPAAAPRSSAAAFADEVFAAADTGDASAAAGAGSIEGLADAVLARRGAANAGGGKIAGGSRSLLDEILEEEEKAAARGENVDEAKSPSYAGEEDFLSSVFASSGDDEGGGLIMPPPPPPPSSPDETLFFAGGDGGGDHAVLESTHGGAVDGVVCSRNMVVTREALSSAKRIVLACRASVNRDLREILGDLYDGGVEVADHPLESGATRASQIALPVFEPAAQTVLIFESSRPLNVILSFVAEVRSLEQQNVGSVFLVALASFQLGDQHKLLRAGIDVVLAGPRGNRDYLAGALASLLPEAQVCSRDIVAARGAFADVDRVVLVGKTTDANDRYARCVHEVRDVYKAVARVEKVVMPRYDVAGLVAKAGLFAGADDDDGGGATKRTALVFESSRPLRHVLAFVRDLRRREQQQDPDRRKQPLVLCALSALALCDEKRLLKAGVDMVLVGPRESEEFVAGALRSLLLPPPPAAAATTSALAAPTVVAAKEAAAAAAPKGGNNVRSLVVAPPATHTPWKFDVAVDDEDEEDVEAGDGAWLLSSWATQLEDALQEEAAKGESDLGRQAAAAQLATIRRRRKTAKEERRLDGLTKRDLAAAKKQEHQLSKEKKKKQQQQQQQQGDLLKPAGAADDDDDNDDDVYKNKKKKGTKRRTKLDTMVPLIRRAVESQVVEVRTCLDMCKPDSRTHRILRMYEAHLAEKWGVDENEEHFDRVVADELKRVLDIARKQHDVLCELDPDDDDYLDRAEQVLVEAQRLWHLGPKTRVVYERLDHRFHLDGPEEPASLGPYLLAWLVYVVAIAVALYYLLWLCWWWAVPKTWYWLWHVLVCAVLYYAIVTTAAVLFFKAYLPSTLFATLRRLDPTGLRHFPFPLKTPSAGTFLLEQAPELAKTPFGKTLVGCPEHPLARATAAEATHLRALQEALLHDKRSKWTSATALSENERMRFVQREFRDVVDDETWKPERGTRGAILALYYLGQILPYTAQKLLIKLLVVGITALVGFYLRTILWFVGDSKVHELYMLCLTVLALILLWGLVETLKALVNLVDRMTSSNRRLTEKTSRAR